MYACKVQIFDYCIGKTLQYYLTYLFKTCHVASEMKTSSPTNDPSNIPTDSPLLCKKQFKIGLDYFGYYFINVKSNV